MKAELTMKQGFSLLEVLFVVGFLVVIGVAITSLNRAALNLIVSAETRTVAHGVAEDGTAYLVAKAKATTYASFISGLGLPAGTCTADAQGYYSSASPCIVYISCPTAENATVHLTDPCVISATEKNVLVGISKLKFVTKVSISSSEAAVSPPQANIQLLTTTSWSKRVNERVVVGKAITVNK